MKNKNLYLKVLLGSSICLLTVIALNILFKKWDLFDSGSRSLESIIIEGINVSIIFFIVMVIFSKNRLRNRQSDK
jgi:uncharacterized membrane protein